MEHLTITHLQHYPIGGENALNITNGEEIKKVAGIYTFDNKKEFWFKSGGWNLHCDYWKPLLLPLSDLYEEIDGEIGIVELATIIDNSLNWELEHLKILGEEWNINGAMASTKSNQTYYFDYRDDGFRFRRVENNIDTLINYVPNQLTLFDYLFSHHYDVYDLCSKGLAIDKRAV